MKKEQYCISEKATVEEAVYKMEKNRIKAVVVLDDCGIMKGLFTQGDMRRFFLQNGKLADDITQAMNAHPVVFTSTYEAETSDRKLIVYPVVGENGEFVTIIDGREPVHNYVLQHVPVVIMAGGKGTRLQPYTNVLPKALIPIGDYTISERIIDSFNKYGCHDYYMILNHKAGMIKAYFQELKKEYSMQFEEEKKFLGTGGGLYYLKDKIDKTFFLSNCDILIHADLECIYKTHKKNKNIITIVSAMKNVKIPYGVIETNEMGCITDIKEKPKLSYLTNTGVYMAEPKMFEYIQEEEVIHMPDIIRRVMRCGENVGVFPISEKSWMDMGQFSEMERMCKELEV